MNKNKNKMLPDEPILTISVAAKLLDISIPTLRVYESEGLIIPYKKKSGQRLYSQRDIQRIQDIRKTIKQYKVSINGIKFLYSLIPCWEYKKCSDEERQACPAYYDYTKPCWAYEEKSDTCKNADCRTCPIYTELSNYDSVKELIRRIKELPILT